MLSVHSKAKFDESVMEYEYRTHAPFTSTTFNPNDEVRIAIQQQELFTYPCESYLLITGKLTKSDGTTTDNSLKLINNAMAFLINEIRYEIGGVIVDRTKNVGITSTLKNYLSLTQGDEVRLENGCWLGKDNTSPVEDFSYCVPLKMLMGFFEDYNRIIVNQKQELVLLLSSSFKKSVFKSGVAATYMDFKLRLDKIYWRVPYVRCADTVRLSLLKVLNQDRTLEMPFRSWELYEYPELPTTTRHSWTVKTSSQLEKPRYVILAFQTGRNSLSTNSSTFDKCSVTDVKLFLNSQYYPYDNLKDNIAVIYEMYARFQSSYYVNTNTQPLLKRNDFINTPIFVIDCSKQPDTLKSGPVDVRLEFEASTAFPANTIAYCLILHDALVEYSPLTGMVNRVL